MRKFLCCYPSRRSTATSDALRHRAVECRVVVSELAKTGPWNEADIAQIMNLVSSYGLQQGSSSTTTIDSTQLHEVKPKNVPSPIVEVSSTSTPRLSSPEMKQSLHASNDLTSLAGTTPLVNDQAPKTPKSSRDAAAGWRKTDRV
eukprot:962018-Pleurochrysis_carterae.AAC.2